MKISFRRFNIYLSLAAVVLATGCATDPAAKEKKAEKKEQTTFRLYMEGSRHDYSSTGTVLVTHEKIPFTVERDPFLTEADLKKAQLIDDPEKDGGYAIQVTFNEHGLLMLDMMTTANKGKHIIVFSQFPPPGEKQPKVKKKNHPSDDDSDSDTDDTATPEPESAPAPSTPGKPRESAWLTAVLIRDRNPSGVFRFTPDATHAEGVRIVHGLKNVIAHAKREEKYNF
ncbi:MAG TPA: hypothetical protein VH619_06080 [Verrucomicrobiae bacterium]|jgi:hypothetical protein|nr:hypothetical protein [Verrucomicrobiae bacterium]